MDNNLKHKPLNVPPVVSVRYKTNYINTAVCELRFPTLLELESALPIKLQMALRKRYPFYSAGQEVSLNLGSAPSSGKRYIFESKKRDWTITLKPSSLSLETNKYTDFNDFYEHMTSMLEAVGSFLDTDFFTRVGLRYINNIPLPSNNMNRKDIGKLINPVLVEPLIGDELGTLTMFHCEVGGHLDNGKYTFRHGFAPTITQDNDSLSYTLDYDYFKEGVEYADVFTIIKQFNSQNFNLFMWSLGEESIKALGEGDNKI